MVAQSVGGRAEKQRLKPQFKRALSQQFLYYCSIRVCVIAAKPVKSPYLFPMYSTCLRLQTLAITHSISSDFYYSSKSSPTLVFNSIKACRGEPWDHKIELPHLLTTKCIWNNFYVCINLLSFQRSIKSIITIHPTHHIHFSNDLLLESCI